MPTNLRSRDFELRENKNSDSQNPLPINIKFAFFVISDLRTRKPDFSYRIKIPRVVQERTGSDFQRPYFPSMRNHKKDNPDPNLTVPHIPMPSLSKNIDSLKLVDWCNPSTSFPSPSKEQSQILSNTKQMHSTLSASLSSQELTKIFTASLKQMEEQYVGYFRQ